jgi:hypothetical protein
MVQATGDHKLIGSSVVVIFVDLVNSSIDAEQDLLRIGATARQIVFGRRNTCA